MPVIRILLHKNVKICAICLKDPKGVNKEEWERYVGQGQPVQATITIGSLPSWAVESQEPWRHLSPFARVNNWLSVSVLTGAKILL